MRKVPAPSKTAPLYFRAEEKGTVRRAFRCALAGNRSRMAKKVALSSSRAAVRSPITVSSGNPSSRRMVSSTAIRPSVRVPVLSRQRTSTRARVSIQNNSWTRVFRRPRLTTPTANAMLMSSTSPSGIIPSTAATVLTMASEISAPARKC